MAAGWGPQLKRQPLGSTPKKMTVTRSLVSTALAASLAAAPAVSQLPPSQRELNGFMLGQHRSVLDTVFGSPYQETRTDDGWTYKVYVIDRDRGAYMAFKFPAERSDLIAAIQIAGDSGTAMYPFLGLALGDDSLRVLQRLVAPVTRQHDAEWALDLWEYEDRNYSVEIGNSGNLRSIQIMGYFGFRRAPEQGEDPLQTLRQALLSAQADRMLDVLAPDFEIFRRREVFRFHRAARTDLTDSTSAVFRILLSDPMSVRAVLSRDDALVGVITNVRVQEKGPVGLVYKFPDTALLREVVFVDHAGRWAVWEIAYR